jgi:hypothetical protein
MSQVARTLFGVSMIISMLVLGLIYVRAFLPIYSLLPDSGPFVSVADTVTVVMPVLIGGMLLFTALYVIAGPVQEERTSSREVRRRR